MDYACLLECRWENLVRLADHLELDVPEDEPEAEEDARWHVSRVWWELQERRQVQRPDAPRSGGLIY